MSESSHYYVAVGLEKFKGKTHGNGQCVAFVQEATSPKTPVTRYWKPGESVEGNLSIERGTAIATFQGGKYQNDTNGKSHAAIYVDQNEDGIWVLHQWVDRKTGIKKPVKESFIYFRNGEGKPRDDASAYSVITVPCNDEDDHE